MIHLTLIVKNYVERPTGVSRREARHCLMLVIIKQHVTPPFKSRLCLQINTPPPLSLAWRGANTQTVIFSPLAALIIS